MLLLWNIKIRMGVRSIWHWGPLTALGIVGVVFYATIEALRVGIYDGSVSMTILTSIWGLCTVGLLYNFFKALYTGPGTLPLGWVRTNIFMF